jgi:DNA-binding beta-propeller fold protein YncE
VDLFKKYRILPVLGGLGLILIAAGATEKARKLYLPTSKAITVPAPGLIGDINSYPATIAISPDRRYAAFLNQGYGTEKSQIRQSIAILDLHSGQVHDFPDDDLRGDERSTLQSYFIGLAFSGDGRHLYASVSSIRKNGIAVYKFNDGQVSRDRTIAIPPQQLDREKQVTYDATPLAKGTAAAYPAGIAVLPASGGDRLLIANNLSDNAILLDVNSGAIQKSFDLSASKYVPAAYPYTVVVNREGTKAWVSLWNASAVAELDIVGGKVARRIELWHSSAPAASGVHPTSLLLNRGENILYVALSNAGDIRCDGIAAVDLTSGAVLRTYRVALHSDDSAGAVPIGIALSEDEKQLFAASASLNAVAVFNLDTSKQLSQSNEVELPVGFVPTEWYPSALAITGQDLLIASAKGEGSGPNSMKAAVQTGLHPNPHPYIATLIGGTIQRLSLSEIARNLSAYTQQVEEDNLLHTDPGKIEFAGGKNPIRHVIYILKENRTYDQLLGDLEAGNGDPSLAMYGADITPNHHKLALQFGVLDNFYDSGEVSANGHLWSDASAASDYIEIIWPIIYRGAERPEDYGNGLDQGLPDMDDPGTGFIWDNLARNHFTYRIYGEMLDITWCKSEDKNSPREGPVAPASSECTPAETNKGDALPANVGNPPGGSSPWPWPVPRLQSVRPTKPAQRDHFDPQFAGFNLLYPDQLRADEFLREFSQFVKARGSGQELPQFILLYLPNDHTSGTRVGKPSPRASIADNDLAVGRVVDAVSHSPYWDDTAIFVVEDDAQNGADHVDAHRSIALVISKYSPRADKPFVDHHFYTTVGMVHTMEDLIGLPAMNQFDSHAPVMAPLFAGSGTQPAYNADYTNLRSGLVYEINGKNAPGADKSAKMDFSRPDAVDPAALNAILWQDAHRHSN